MTKKLKLTTKSLQFQSSVFKYLFSFLASPFKEKPNMFWAALFKCSNLIMVKENNQEKNDVQKY